MPERIENGNFNDIRIFCSREGKITMMFLPLFVVLSTICTVFGVLDEICFENCSCCKDKTCGPGVHGWTNVCTIGCIDGHRGGRCYELCQYENCKSCGDNTGSTECEECYDGYYLGPKKDCSSQCPSNCKTCSSSTVSAMCTECKEGFYDKDGSTTCPYVKCPSNCDCNGQDDCVSCKAGYYDTSTSCSKQCPVNCLTCESKEACNVCKNGFYNGFKYDNNTKSQFHNCTYACRGTCTQCQSYNICSNCIRGKYDSACQKDCSIGCKNNTCSIDNGHCECIVNFTGDRCLKCVDGYHGLFCNETCYKHCKGQACERMSGHCSDGCIDGNISGATCNRCIEGMFDERCDKKCPENCKDFRCDRFSGVCSDGCKSDFDGTKCDLCIQGKYGTNCELNCPVNCGNKVCNRSSGTCFDCVGNFQGTTCDECKHGFYGQNCNMPCSQHCANYSCDTDNGNCLYGCMDGFSGDKCCVMSENCLECNNSTECKTCVSGFFKTSCNETCPECCKHSCDFLTGECILIKEAAEQKDAPTAVPAVLGSMFTLSFSLNIVLVLLALFLKRKIELYRRKQSRAQSELTYENQLHDIAEQFPQARSDGTEKTVEKTVYEGISRVNEQEHEYQQVSYDHGTSSSSHTFR